MLSPMLADVVTESNMPAWVTGGSLGLMGSAVIWWLIRHHIPTLTATFEKSLIAVLTDSKADRETREKESAAMREAFTEAQKELRHDAKNQVNQMAIAVQAAQAQTIAILQQQREDQRANRPQEPNKA